MKYETKWRRIDRLVSILPRQRERLGCRRKEHTLRAAVDNVPEGTDPNILLRRRLLARGRYEQA